MTLRASKPAFNVREKLTELGRRFGLKGSELIAAETAQDARDLVRAGRKNLVINGDLRIWHRSTSATLNSSTNTQHQTADRWNHYHSTDGAVTESRSTDVPTGAGFYYSMKHEVSTADTSISTTQYHCHKYDIEGYNVAHLMWGTAQAKPITVSFWAKSSVTGDYGFCIRPGANNGRFYVDTLTISQANTWKKYSFTVPGCPDGTWEKTTSAGLQVQISHSMGTEYVTSTLRQWINVVDVSPTTQVNWMATVGNTWYITGLQVEVGKNATEFEHRPYGEELSLCQRYYQKMYFTTSDYPFGFCYTYQQGSSACSIPLAAPMRTSSPNITFATLRIRGYNQDGTNGSQNISNITGQTQESHALLQADLSHSNVPSDAVGSASVLTNGVSSSASYLAVDAEL